MLLNIIIFDHSLFSQFTFFLSVCREKRFIILSMDGCKGKRSVNRMVLPRKVSSTVLLRENMSKKDEKSVSFCSRIGCSAKVSYTKGTRMDNNTKLGSSSNGKEIVGSSSRTPGGFGYLRKPATFTTGSPLIGSSVSSSSGSEHTVRGGNLSRNGLRCSSVSDALSTNATRISVTKRKNSDGESSSSSTRASKPSVSGTKGRNLSSSSGITVSDNRRNRMVPTIRDNSVVSSSGRRSGRLGAVASPATSRQTPQPAAPVNPNPSLSVTPSNSHSSTDWLSSMMPGSPSEAQPSSSLVDRDGLSDYNMNGIAEVVSVTLVV